MESNTTVDDDFNGNVVEKMHQLEKECIGYENYINAEEKNYVNTLENLRKIIGEI